MPGKGPCPPFYSVTALLFCLLFCPSYLTRVSPLLPHRYLPGVSPAQPGLKIAFCHADLLTQFPDASAPYLVFGCTLRERFGGTLFRFPLRSEKTAPQSDIKPSACTPEQVLHLFQAFKEQLPQALLFLKSVRKVSVWARQPAGTAAEPGCSSSSRFDGLQLLFQASTEASDSDPSGGETRQSMQVLSMCCIDTQPLSVHGQHGGAGRILWHKLP